MKWKASPSAVYSDLDGMTALLDTKSNIYFCLSGVGPFVWDNLRAEISADQLCDAVTSAYDVPAEMASKDIADLLSRLSAAGLIVAVDAN